MSPEHKSRRGSVIVHSDLWDGPLVRLIEFGKPDGDGLVYQRLEVDVPRTMVGLVAPPDDLHNIRNKSIAATIYPAFLEDGLYAKINPWPGPLGDVFSKGMACGVEIIHAGAGHVDANGYVWGYRLFYCYLDTRSTDKKVIEK